MIRDYVAKAIDRTNDRLLVWAKDRNWAKRIVGRVVVTLMQLRIYLWLKDVALLARHGNVRQIREFGKNLSKAGEDGNAPAIAESGAMIAANAERHILDRIRWPR